MDKAIIDFYASRNLHISKLIDQRYDGTTPDQVESMAEKAYREYKDGMLPVKLLVIGKYILTNANLVDTTEFLARQAKLQNANVVVSIAEKARDAALKQAEIATKKLEKHKKAFVQGVDKIKGNIAASDARVQTIRYHAATAAKEYEIRLKEQKEFASKSDQEKLHEIDRVKRESIEAIARTILDIKEKHGQEIGRLTSINKYQADIIKKSEVETSKQKAVIEQLRLKRIEETNNITALNAQINAKDSLITRLKNSQELVVLSRDNRIRKLKNWIYILAGAYVFLTEFLILGIIG